MIDKKDIFILSAFIVGILLGAGLNEYKYYSKKPTWKDKQVVIPGNAKFISPIPDIPIRIDPIKTPLQPEIKQEKVLTFTYSNRAIKCLNQRKDIANKLLKKFGEQEIIELISKESSLDHLAINPTSGACGLFQAYPCKKLGCSLNDIDCQIEWGYSYILSRYGSASKALAFHMQKGWY